MSLSVRVETGAARAALDEMVGRLVAAIGEATEAVGELIVDKARGEEPHDTGGLAGSLGASPPIPLGVGVARVKAGPGTAYGRRIEIGFHGVDSIGRHYDEGGHFVFRRAVSAVTPRALDVFVARISQAIEG